MSDCVLVLEDEPLICDLVCTVLTDAGCGVMVCDSLERLKEVAAEMPWVVAVADFWGESHQILDDDERAEVVQLAQTVPTILVTGRVWASKEVAADLGLVALVPKPFDVDELCLIVTEALGDRMDATTP
jgi:DNA-binding NtrC family response regulator